MLHLHLKHSTGTESVPTIGQNEVEGLLLAAGAGTIRELEGKIVEVFQGRDGKIKSISPNQNLSH